MTPEIQPSLGAAHTKRASTLRSSYTLQKKAHHGEGGSADYLEVFLSDLDLRVIKVKWPTVSPPSAPHFPAFLAVITSH